MRVLSVELRDFRSYEAAAALLGPGLTVVSGPNGAGKTNLLEALYFGCRPVVPDHQRARGGPVRRRDHSRRRALRGRRRSARALGRLRARAAEADARRRRDRRAAARRARAPARQRVPSRSAGADQGSSGAAPRPPRPVRRGAVAGAGADAPRVRAGAGAAQRADRPDPRGRGSRASLPSWDGQLAEHGHRADGRSRAAVAVGRATAAGGSASSSDSTASRRSLPPAVAPRRMRPGSARSSPTGPPRISSAASPATGPHRDDLASRLGGRELRAYGSQGQQRLALLALLLAEREAIAEQRGAPPLMLLDDVMSELDGIRRRALVELLRQAVASR